MKVLIPGGKDRKELVSRNEIQDSRVRAEEKVSAKGLQILH